ncbi:hypothetical protein TW81_09555 [Vibrio galatheae]|uniref:DNA-3-methyladenine glycosylase I n=2 Tax=Vibrio galatheae TaxID=579748 RepID=A0A0F4NMD4_9VIBR|nr:hypothetical protein TW81_09555 [Vibrio galatheae]
MEQQRCAWANVSELDKEYHDNEWGVAIHDDNRLFEILSLEGAQAGLSWTTILKKREGYRQAFYGFDIDRVCQMTEHDIERLVINPEIVRHRGKIESVINNAQQLRIIQTEFGSVDAFFWRYVDNRQIVNHWQKMSELPSSTDLSKQISKDLKKRGFKFVGPTTVYAFMQAAGLVDDHLQHCPAKKKSA